MRLCDPTGKLLCFSIFGKIPSRLDLLTWLRAFQNVCEQNKRTMYVCALVCICGGRGIHFSLSTQHFHRHIWHKPRSLTTATKKVFTFSDRCSKYKKIITFYQILLAWKWYFPWELAPVFDSVCMLFTIS